MDYSRIYVIHERFGEPIACYAENRDGAMKCFNKWINDEFGVTFAKAHPYTISETETLDEYLEEILID